MKFHLMCKTFYSVSVDCYYQRRIIITETHWLLCFLCWQSEVLHWLCYVLVIFFNLWLVVFDPTHCCHCLRTKLFPQRSVLIPIDCCAVGSEPSTLNLLVLLKLKCLTAGGVRLSSVLFWLVSLSLFVSLVGVLENESLILFDYRT